MFFEDIAKKYSSNIAIKYDETAYSYLDVNNKANELIKFLVKRGISQGDVVAIANTKKINSFALMIACLKTGIIYVNIDIEGPAERLEKIDKILLLNNNQFRHEIKEKIKNELTDSLNKENILYEEDKILLYKIYLKLKKEFEALDKSKL